MEEDQTWRTFLGKVIADPHERQRIADSINVNPITLTRWTTGKSHPRLDNLLPLLAALPHYRQQLTALITKEYPSAFQSRVQDGEQALEISSSFYTQILNTYTSSTPQQREITVCNMILQQLLIQLDPHQAGMIILLARCVPPRTGQPVRSLRQVNGRGTTPQGNQLEYMTQFFGAESQTGYAAITGHPVVIQSKQEKERLFPLHSCAQEESSVAYPILLSDYTAGTLYIASTQCHYFTQPHLDLIQCYVDLLVLAFEAEGFYALSTLELGIMPPAATKSRHCQL
ncbi:GAF domain-containing protein [Dictyobacter kobayashii]|uniref:GAF domain-containing protein n=1 Tax=Dictyobacter kobayashii TaxID=2014872 RepID=A0A402AG49_9CHLR|nr:GAF domain-containing protein [Dictyobacter kobayashii]GCE18098.1 hypothetical protein KDK_18980 [Dictyobacter kobayashii]